VEYIVILLAIAVDLITKAVIQATMQEGETIVIIPRFLEFHFTYNTAAAFSFDFGLGGLIGKQGVMTVFIITTVISVLLFGFIMYKLKNRSLWARLAFALIIGGAIGNLYDRIVFAKVRDFIQIVYFGLELFGSTSFAVFNVADACLVVGAIMFVVYVLFLEGKDKKNVKDQDKKEGKTTEETEKTNDEITQISQNPDTVSENLEQSAGEN
jgi:signal peptidase II